MADLPPPKRPNVQPTRATKHCLSLPRRRRKPGQIVTPSSLSPPPVHHPPHFPLLRYGDIFRQTGLARWKTFSHPDFRTSRELPDGPFTPWSLSRSLARGSWSAFRPILSSAARRERKSVSPLAHSLSVAGNATLFSSSSNVLALPPPYLAWPLRAFLADRRQPSLAKFTLAFHSTHPAIIKYAEHATLSDSSLA